MSPPQLEAIATKYIKNNPENWHIPVGALIMYSFGNACKSNGKPIIFKFEGVK
jgi:hypothetical protein